MQSYKNNVSFGMRFTPTFMTMSRKFVPRGSLAGGVLMAKLKPLGGDMVTLDSDTTRYMDRMKFPKYKFEVKIWGCIRTVERYTRAFDVGIRKILRRASKKGNLQEVKSSLLVDFPERESLISKYSSILEKTPHKRRRLFGIL